MCCCGPQVVLPAHASQERLSGTAVGTGAGDPRAVLQEWLLLSECEVSIVETSAYSVSSLLYRREAPAIYVLDLDEQGKRNTSCDPGAPVPLDDLVRAQEAKEPQTHRR